MRFHHDSSPRPHLHRTLRSHLVTAPIEVTEMVVHQAIGTVPPPGYFPGDLALIEALSKHLPASIARDETPERIPVEPTLRAEFNALCKHARGFFSSLRFQQSHRDACVASGATSISLRVEPHEDWHAHYEAERTLLRLAYANDPDLLAQQLEHVNRAEAWECRVAEAILALGDST